MHYNVSLYLNVYNLLLKFFLYAHVLLGRMHLFSTSLIPCVPFILYCFFFILFLSLPCFWSHLVHVFILFFPCFSSNFPPFYYLFINFDIIFSCFSASFFPVFHFINKMKNREEMRRKAAGRSKMKIREEFGWKTGKK